MNVDSTALSIVCADGFPLAATKYSGSHVKAAIMIAPATGIRRGVYDAFARHLAASGYGVIVYDNRGIGQSQRGPLKENDATLVAWGRLDMPAVLERLQDEFPDVSYHLVGHSAGGQLVGLMPNALALRSMANVASSSGSVSNMTPLYRMKAIAFLKYLLPLTARFQGVGRTDLVGMGGPLPAGVALDWRDWCMGQGYVEVALLNDPSLHDHLYDALEFPSLWLYATDDDIANEANVDDMIRVYSRTRAQKLELEPSAYAKKAIGHMGFFRAPDLWPLLTDWLDAQVDA